MITRACTAAAAALLLASCATTGAPGQQQNWAPQIDAKGVDQTRYAADVAECNQYARENPNADRGEAQKRGAMKYGAMGAGLAGLAVVATGGLALVPMLAGSIATTVGTGAVLGGAGGGAIADANYHNIVTSCLVGRGYKVFSAAPTL